MILERRAFKVKTPKVIKVGDTDLLLDNVKKEIFSEKTKEDWDTILFIEKVFDEHFKFETIEVKIAIANHLMVEDMTLAEVYAALASLQSNPRTKYSSKHKELCGDSTSIAIEFDDKMVKMDTGSRGGFGEVYSHYKKTIADSKKQLLGHVVVFDLPLDLNSIDSVERNISSLCKLEKIETKAPCA